MYFTWDNIKFYFWVVGIVPCTENKQNNYEGNTIRLPHHTSAHSHENGKTAIKQVTVGCLRVICVNYDPFIQQTEITFKECWIETIWKDATAFSPWCNSCRLTVLSQRRAAYFISIWRWQNEAHIKTIINTETKRSLFRVQCKLKL